MRWFLFLVILTIGSLSLGQSEGILNQLLAPGPLIKGHAELEGSDCLKCHDAGKGLPDSKCLDCHKEIKPFVDSKRGFHGLVTKNCHECHGDHKGREFDSLKFDISTFDHKKLTGYTLEGKHEKLKCTECHTEKRTKKPIRKNDTRFLGQASSCVSCHKKHDIHKFTGEFAKKDCNACHSNTSWKDGLKFDHNRDTKYRLEGKHQDLKCNDCHMTDQRKKTLTYSFPHLKQKQCLSCHEDFHKQRLSKRFQGGQCLECHTQSQWKIDSFNHSKTRFKLNGKHATAQCTDCHKTKTPVGKTTYKPKDPISHLNFTGLRTACISCHKDVHLFGSHSSKKLGPLNQCTTCHNEESWKSTTKFSHNSDTRFAIDGKHVDLKCTDCHVPLKLKPKLAAKFNKYHWQELSAKTCETCHASPHIGKFSAKLAKVACTTCHVTESWQAQKSGKTFDHSTTRFKLTGAHKTTKCSSCHGEGKKQVFKFKNFDQQFCVDCHSNVHKKQFSPTFENKACTTCHGTASFKDRLPFDHSTTKYPLEGEHKKLECASCHKSDTKKQVELTWPNFQAKQKTEKLTFSPAVFLFPSLESKKCSTCHSDYHNGQLDANCSTCHTVDGWKPSTFDHNKMSKFILKEKHAVAKCADCHKSSDKKVSYKGKMVSTPHYKPMSGQCKDCHKDPHRGNLGSQCIECHTEKTWRTTKDFHKNFTLSGVHYMLECAECHQDGRKLAGMSQDCLNCHQKDDVHNGTLPNCSECHTQHFWEVSRFKHTLTQFPLRGAHRTLECSECHSGKSYKGLSSSCYTCHRTDFEAFPAPHTSGNTSCMDCHTNQFTFESVNN